MPSINKTNPVEWGDGQQSHMVAPVFTEEREKFVEKERRGDHRRSGIKLKPVMPHDTPAAAELIETFDEGHVVAECARAQAGRDSTEAAADDDCGPSACYASLRCRHKLFDIRVRGSKDDQNNRKT